MDKKRTKDVPLKVKTSLQRTGTSRRKVEWLQCMDCYKQIIKDSDTYVWVEAPKNYAKNMKILGLGDPVRCKECNDSVGGKEIDLKQLSFSELNLKTEKGKIVVPPEKKPEDKLQEQQKTTVRRGIKPRTSYVSPSREGKVTITAHVDPDLKEAVTKLADQSNLTFNEFITSILKREVASPAQHKDQTLHLSEEALEKTREAEEAIHRLTVNLSSHSR